MPKWGSLFLWYPIQVAIDILFSRSRHSLGLHTSSFRHIKLIRIIQIQIQIISCVDFLQHDHTLNGDGTPLQEVCWDQNSVLQTILWRFAQPKSRFPCSKSRCWCWRIELVGCNYALFTVGKEISERKGRHIWMGRVRDCQWKSFPINKSVTHAQKCDNVRDKETANSLRAFSAIFDRLNELFERSGLEIRSDTHRILQIEF
jgi:hypothetical protein